MARKEPQSTEQAVPEPPVLAPAEERAAALSARVDAARAEVAELSRLCQEAEAAAHAARVAADFDSAGTHDAAASDLRGRLKGAEAFLNALEMAQREIAEQRRIEQHTAALAAAEERHRQLREEAEAHFVRVQPLIDAARDTIVDALAAEKAAMDAYDVVFGLQIALGIIENGSRGNHRQPVRDHYWANQLWQTIHWKHLDQVGTAVHKGKV